jgi:hypothetical protein
LEGTGRGVVSQSEQNRAQTRPPECRRARNRAAWSGTVTLWIGCHRLPCEGLDLSETGVALTGNWGAYPGQRVTVELELFGHPVHVSGVVAWAKFGREPRWGVSFFAATTPNRQRLAAFVASRTQEPDQIRASEDPFAPGASTEVFADPGRPPLPPPPPFGWDAGSPDVEPRVRTGETVVVSSDTVFRPSPGTRSTGVPTGIPAIFPSPGHGCGVLLPRDVGGVISS